MDNSITIFENSQFGKIRTIDQNGEPWFVAKDVCDALGILNHRDSTARLDGDEKGVVSTDTPGGRQYLITVNEFGLYNLTLSSRKREAKQFKRWVTHEILPAIRKHGMFATAETAERILGDPDFLITTLTALKTERAARTAAEQQIKLEAPKVAFANSVSVADSAILVGDFAKILKQNGFDIGANRLFQWMRTNGYLINRQGTDYNNPTQKSMELELFKIKETVISHGDGHTTTSITPKMTGKGQCYFLNKFLQMRERGETQW